MLKISTTQKWKGKRPNLIKIEININKKKKVNHIIKK